jgi:uncharacterized protein (TIGR00369 family)
LVQRTIDDVRQVLARQSFNQLMGAEITRYDDEAVVLELPIAPQLQQQNGFVHGGVICYLADNALSFAGGRVLGPDVLTSDISIRYLRPAQGDRLIARASTQAMTSRTAVTQGEISVLRDGSEYICAAGTATVTRVRTS